MAHALLDTTCGRRTYLLLMYLFVLEAAADCPYPHPKDNMVLTDDALLLNAFKEGVVITLECAKGYVIDSGSGVIDCIDGSWTEPDLICIKMDCGPLKAEPNMRFENTEDTRLGAVIRIICDTGYQIRGSSYKECFSSGWRGKAKCQIVTCPIPVVENGRILGDSQERPTYGETVKFACNDGYILSHEENVTCSETGGYSPPPPECRGVTTEDRITTHGNPTSVPPEQAASTSSPSSAASTAASPASTAPTSLQGGRDILIDGDEATTASTTSVTSTSSLFQDKHDRVANTDAGSAPVIISVIFVTLGVTIGVYLLYRFQLRKKGNSESGTAPIC